MDRIADARQVEQEIEAVMRDEGVERVEAEVIVGLRYGELHGDGDLLFLRPLTDAQRRRLGLGRRPEDVLVELGELVPTPED